LLDHRQRFPTSGRDFSEMIANLGKWWQVGAPMEWWLSIRTVGINSVIHVACTARTRMYFPMRRFAMIYILKTPSNNSTKRKVNKSKNERGFETECISSESTVVVCVCETRTKFVRRRYL